MRHLNFFVTAVSAIGFSLLFPVGNPVSAQNFLSSYKAREIGPSVFGGRIVDIDVDSENPHRILVASASGGLWATSNNGTTWKNIFDNQRTISIGDIAIDPTNPQVIWVGTGEANNQRSSLWGDGVYRTNDGGKSWTCTGLKDTHHIGRIVVDPRNPETVYVAALGHLYTTNQQRGLFKTADGGKTWEKILYVNEHVGVVDCVMDPGDSDTLYAATYERIRKAWDFDGAGPGSAIYKTTDGGKSWKKLTRGLPEGEIGRIGIDVFRGNSKILYATVSNQNPAPPKPDTPRAPQRRRSDPAQNPAKKKNGKPVSDAKSVSPNDQIDTPFGFKLQRNDGPGFVITEIDRAIRLAD